MKNVKRSIRDGSKIFRVPKPGPSTGGQRLFRKKKWGRRLFFSNKLRRVETFFGKKLGGEDLFYYEIWKSKISYFKKSHFEDQKVIYVGSSDSSVFIGVWYIQKIHWFVFMTWGKVAFGRNKKGGRRDFFEKN